MQSLKKYSLDKRIISCMKNRSYAITQAMQLMAFIPET